MKKKKEDTQKKRQNLSTKNSEKDSSELKRKKTNYQKSSSKKTKVSTSQDSYKNNLSKKSKKRISPKHKERKEERPLHGKKHVTNTSEKKEVRSTTKRVVHFIWNIFFYICMFTLLIGAGLMAIMQQQDKSLNGYRMFGVLTNSMVSPDNTLKKGGFRSGDIIVTKEVNPKTIRVGDVITYRPSTNPTNASSNFLTHRVVKINNHSGNEEGLFFITKGDANQSDDMPISSTALIGKEIFVIPKIGGILAFIKENWLLSIIFLLSFLGFVWVIKSYIFTSISTKFIDDENTR